MMSHKMGHCNKMPESTKFIECLMRCAKIEPKGSYMSCDVKQILAAYIMRLAKFRRHINFKMKHDTHTKNEATKQSHIDV